MGFSLSHIIVVTVIAILLFGRGRISDLMGDVAKGIKSFKKGLADDENDMHQNNIQTQSKIASDIQMTHTNHSASQPETNSNSSHKNL